MQLLKLNNALWGVRHRPPTTVKKWVLGSENSRRCFGRAFVEGLGQPASSARLGFRFQFGTPQYTQGFGGVLEPHICGVKKENGGPGPMDAHYAGLEGLLAT